MSDNPGAKTIDRKKKLGKGLGALLGETRREEPLVRSASGGAAQSGAVAPLPQASSSEGLASIPGRGYRTVAGPAS